MQNILIDTDVILDFFFDRKPYSDDAAKILSLCESKQIKGFITSVIISNIYYLLRKTTSHNRVIESLKQLIEIIEIATSNKEVILKSLYSNFNDFEDAIQNFSAEISGEVNIIITRNVKDYKNSNLAVFTPENYLKTFSLNH